MRDDLHNDLISELERIGRKPVQLLEFLFPSGTVYASDRSLAGLLPEAYLPIVESWGELEITSATSDFLTGRALGTKQVTLTLFNGGNPSFSSRFSADPPENVVVNHYQWFEGISGDRKAVIDKFVIQDPIVYGESSYLLNIDLVSFVQYSNPYIGQIDATTNEFYGVTIGAISQATGTPYGHADTQGGTPTVGAFPQVYLDGDISKTATTITVTTSPITAGFPTAGTIIIDYEKITYTGLTATQFTGCTRGVDAGSSLSQAMLHESGQSVFEFDREYLYSFGTGPLDAMGPVYVDGEVYSGQHTIYKDRNPVQVGFVNGDPFPTTGQSSSTNTATQNNFSDHTATYLRTYALFSAYLGNIQYDDGVVAALAVNHPSSMTIPAGHGIGYFTSRQSSGSPSSLYNYAVLKSAIVNVETSNVSSNFEQEITVTVENSGIYDYDTVTGAGGTQYKTFDVSGGGFSALRYRVKANFTNGVDTDFTFSGTWNFASWDYIGLDLTYYTKTKEFSTAVACDLSSGSGVTNPADAIIMVLSTMGVTSEVDQRSFDVARLYFTNHGYEFNGFIDGGMRCREVLSGMQQQSRSRIINSGGKVKLKVRRHLSERSTDRLVKPSETKMKSITVSRQPVSDVRNRLTIKYDAVTTENTYTEQLTVEDYDSIDRYGLQEEVLEFNLVEDATMAQDLADFYLEELKTPASFVSFSAYLKQFDVEINDVLKLSTDFSDLKSVFGDVVQANRVFGSGKINQINLINFMIRSYLADYDLEEFIDSGVATDSVETFIDPAGYGVTTSTGGYGE